MYVKVPFLILIGYSFHRILTPPAGTRASLSGDDRSGGPTSATTYRWFTQFLPFAMKSFTWLTVAGEIIAIIICGLRGILPETWHRSLPSIFTGNVPTSDSEPSFSITALFLFGTALVMCGTHLRLAAKRALGQHFTYEVLVHRKHTLVTSYPYTLVRHPGYVGGGIAAVGGDVALILAPGSWIREVLWPLWVRQSGMIGHILAAVFILGPPVIHALMLGGLVARVPGEDRLMRETFGPEWTAWAKRVPYKLIPGVY